MKKTASILLLLLAFTSSFAQDYTTVKETSSDEEIRTLFRKPKNDISVGWSLGINSAYTQFDKQNVWLVGMSAGPVINHNWTTGIQLNAIVNSYNLDYDYVIDSAAANLVGGFGGFFIQYTLFPKSPVHVSFPFSIGAGYLGYLRDNGYRWENGHPYWDSNAEILEYDVFFVIEPGVQVEFNLLKFMRLAMGVSYRYSPNLELEQSPSDLVNQFNGTIGLKFGKF